MTRTGFFAPASRNNFAEKQQRRCGSRRRFLRPRLTALCLPAFTALALLLSACGAGSNANKADASRTAIPSESAQETADQEPAFPGTDRQKPAIRIETKSLSEKEQQRLGLTGPWLLNEIFHYRADRTLRGIYFFADELKDGVLTPLCSMGGEPVSGDSAKGSGQNQAILTPSGNVFIQIQPSASGSGGISFSWQNESGNQVNYLYVDADLYSHYDFTAATHIDSLPDQPYNRKIPLAVLIQTNSDNLETISPSEYTDLTALSERQFERAIFLGAVFTDFPVQEELVSYNGIVRDSADLSQETLDWLEMYNALSVEEQRAISSAPAEFFDRDKNAVKTEDAAGT